MLVMESAGIGSFFSKSKITLRKWMLFLHFWVRQCPVTDVMKDAEVDKHTAIDVFQWFREVCSSSLMQGPQIVLGGPGMVVHIDESLFHHKPKVTVRSNIQYSVYNHFSLEQSWSSHYTRSVGFWTCRHIDYTLFRIYGNSPVS